MLPTLVTLGPGGQPNGHAITWQDCRADDLGDAFASVARPPGCVLDPDHRFLVTPLAEPGRWGVEMDLLATGSAITWLAALLGGDLTAAGLVELAASTDPAYAPCCFLT